MIALVTGATGCIGYALAHRLVLSGEYDEVRALVRSGRENDLPPTVRAVAGTLDDLSALQTAAKNVEVVFHCAAKVHDPNGDADEFFRVNRDGTQNLLNACSEQNKIPPRFVFFSTVAVYGDDTPQSGLLENGPLCPQTPYAASKAEAEKRVCQWGGDKTPVTILRVATVYGPRDRGNLARMMKAVAQNRFLMVGNGKNVKTCASVENVAAAAVAVSRQNLFVDGLPLVVADPAPVTLRELHDAMHTALLEAGWKFPARRLPAVALPVPVALALSSGVTGAARLAGRKSPLTPAQVKRLVSDNVYQTERLSTIAGYFPVSTLSQGMLDAARWLVSEGQLR